MPLKHLKAKILLQSLNLANGEVITTWLLEYPRIIHAEMLTHRLFSRNTASSRAVPVSKMLKRIKDKPFIPSYWGKNQRGMSAANQVNFDTRDEAERLWLACLDEVLYYSKSLSDLGIHKQIANRVTEAFQYIQVVMTTTCDVNFFRLRDDENAQPEIAELARKMKEAQGIMGLSYQELNPGEWHLPFIHEEEKQEYSLKDQLVVSCARCARVSYFLVDGSESDFEKDLALANRLKDSGHFSPFEHAAVALEDKVMVGNFTGWMQYRKFIEGEDNKDVDKTTRILTPSQARSIYSNYNPL